MDDLAIVFDNVREAIIRAGEKVLGMIAPLVSGITQANPQITEAQTQVDPAIQAARIQADAAINAAWVQGEFTLAAGALTIVAAGIAYLAAGRQVRLTEKEYQNRRRYILFVVYQSLSKAYYEISLSTEFMDGLLKGDEAYESESDEPFEVVCLPDLPSEEALNVLIGSDPDIVSLLLTGKETEEKFKRIIKGRLEASPDGKLLNKHVARSTIIKACIRYMKEDTRKAMVRIGEVVGFDGDPHKRRSVEVEKILRK